MMSILLQAGAASRCCKQVRPVLVLDSVFLWTFRHASELPVVSVRMVYLKVGTMRAGAT